MIGNIKEAAKKLLSGDDTGHGFDHVERVFELAMMLCDKEKADRDVVALAAILHDCDDYKLFGDESAKHLLNARKIMQNNGIEKAVEDKVCEIIGTMGYAKSLKGVRPQTLEGQIVSDADMLDAIGAMGIVRCMAYALARCNQHGAPIFDKDVFPDLWLSADDYKKENRKSDNFINHFFEKMLKIKNMMFTAAGKEEALVSA